MSPSKLRNTRTVGPNRHQSFATAAAFTAALREHDEYLRGVAWAVVRDANVIDDVMQMTYERAYRGRNQFDGRSALRTWLHTICYRTAVDHIRRVANQRNVPLESESGPRPEAVTTSQTGEIVVGMEATDILRALNPEQRALLYMTAGLGYSFEEVAEIVGMKRGTVASKVSRAKAKLRRGRAS